jgi:hypothetical protein
MINFIWKKILVLNVFTVLKNNLNHQNKAMKRHQLNLHCPKNINQDQDITKVMKETGTL